MVSLTHPIDFSHAKNMLWKP
ncbi:unnamed protein product [Kuraishia capsulata CBS 1993]|uniref:Uncharacterized protein n=1 Tax=Kuraishia capsulata CBS 1993 TaxID=1382522 RepID=W6MTR3_9ASCO|nr:unnamed protein product [Kuraishia capsulata CBS 1993]